MLIMKIEKLEKGRIKVIGEDDSHVILYSKEIKTLNLVEGEQVEDDVWDKALGIAVTRGKKRVYYLLGSKDYTVTEITRKLKKNLYHENIIRKIIAHFIERRYLDDENYVEKYYECYQKTKSHRMMRMKLKEKGIEERIIKSFFEENAHQEDERETAIEILNRKYRNKIVTGEERNKMIQFMLRKGFDYNIINKIVLDFIENHTE